jgi:hypothetical protein
MSYLNRSVWPVLGIALAGVAAMGIGTQKGVNKEYSRFASMKVEKESAEKKNEIAGAAEWYKLTKANQVTGFVDPADVMSAREQADKLVRQSFGKKSRAFDQMKWEETGPSNVGGRTRAMITDRNNSNTLYMGGVSGGFWKSTDNGDTWVKALGSDTTSAISVCAIAQAANGDIYYGTGEGHYFPTGSSGGGQLGEGVWKSTDGGNTFTQLLSTKPANGNVISDPWVYVDKLVAHPTDPNKIIAATNGGLKITSDGGATWVKPGTLTINTQINDAEISTDGNKVLVSTANNVYLSNDGGQTFGANLMGNNGLPSSSGITRVEVAIAPSDANYMYVVAASNDGKLKGVYKSTNGGTSWTTIGTGGSAVFDPLGTQGDYNIALGVHPTNPEMVFLGGQLDLWRYTPTALWQAIAYWLGSPVFGKEVHADMHGVMFNPSNPENMYVITDGGFYRTFNCSAPEPFFAVRNKNYSTAQCYGLGANRLGQVVFGTQDNGSGVLGRIVNDPRQSKDLTGGDGTRCAMSDLNTNYIFTSVVNGEVRRANDGGSNGAASFKSMFDRNIDNSPAGSPDGAPDDNAGWIAPIHFEERVIDGQEKSVFLLGTAKRLWLTQGATASKTYWFNLRDGNGDNTVTFSAVTMSNDGKFIYAGTQGGLVYRVEVPSVWDSTYKYFDTLTNLYGTQGYPYRNQIVWTQIANYGRYVTDLDCDPTGNTLVVTLGNYGNSSYVFRSNDARNAVSPVFSDITGNLPKMPVYSVVMVGSSTTKYIIGTEMGLYGTSNSGSSWDDINMNFTNPNDWHPRVAVYEVIEKGSYETSTGMYKGSVIYSGTHGRGTFRSVTLAPNFWPTSTNDISADVHQIKVYPNPAQNQIQVDLGATFDGTTQVKVFSLTGSLVKSVVLNGSYQTFQMNVEGLPAGAYIIYANNGSQKATNRFIKQ